MARKKAGKRKNRSSIETLLSMPWQVSIGLGVAMYIGLKSVLPALAKGNMYLKVLTAAASSVAWLFSGVFFLIGLIVFFRGKHLPVKPERDKSSQTDWADDFPREPTAGKSSTFSSEQVDTLRDEPVVGATPQQITWSLELIRNLEWKRFEDVCQQFYEKKGIRSETTALGPDGGIDIRLYQDDSGKPTAIVQCKAWGERFVGVKPVRELLGVMTHERIGNAFFMTSGFYSDEAKAVAQANRITLIDGTMFLLMIQRLPAEKRDSLLAFATTGDYMTPTCPSCGVKMVAIKGRGERPDFWGCRNFPRCRQKLGMRRA